MQKYFTISMLLVLMALAVSAQEKSPVKKGSKRPIYQSKNFSPTSRLFVIDSIAWCRSISGQLLPENITTKFKMDEACILWVQLRGDHTSLEALKKNSVQPAYIKFFRTATYGLTPEKLANEVSEFDLEGKQQRESVLQRCEESVLKSGYFTIRMWTTSISFRHEGAYSVKLVDFENNDISGKGGKLLDIFVESSRQ